MKPTPLLDFWQPPTDAGRPVALLATTFVLDPNFLEADCLARFLDVQTVDYDSGSAGDIVARLDLEERLVEPSVTVLADRSTRADRTSLRWDLLHCHVPGGLLHAKAVVLLWERATRVLVGSANLTPAGYRKQIELQLAADLGPACVLPADQLNALADELASYVDLIPGASNDVPAVERARGTIEMFRERVTDSAKGTRGRLRVAIAPTSPTAIPLDRRSRVWEGAQPLRATHLSPFWDGSDSSALKQVGRELTGRPKDRRRHRITTVITPQGTVPVTELLRDAVNDVVQLGKFDDETVPRTLHAKALLVESDQWVAALVGSSNHTRAGLGLTGNRHRELNVWLGAPSASAEGKALLSLIPAGSVLPRDTPVDEDLPDEDEAEAPALPLGFRLCRLALSGDGWSLSLQLDPPHLPTAWKVATTSGDLLLDAEGWRTTDRPDEITRPVLPDSLPTYLLVTWSHQLDTVTAEWTVIADDRHALPPGPSVSDLKAHQLFSALARGKSLTEAVREQQQRLSMGDGAQRLDPLKRFDDQNTLLRRGRALGAALARFQMRLERPVLTIEALAARLGSALGPEFLAKKVLEDVAAGDQARSEGMFTVAEIALATGRVDWVTTLQHVDAAAAHGLVATVFDRLEEQLAALGDEPASMRAYAVRALEEARRCVRR